MRYCPGGQTRYGHPYRDIIAKADDRISSGRIGADLRFGHDYTILPLMQILDVNGIGHDNLTADEIHRWSQTYQVPMGANLQFVFYRSKKNPTVLFKVLLRTFPCSRITSRTACWTSPRRRA